MEEKLLTSSISILNGLGLGLGVNPNPNPCELWQFGFPLSSNKTSWETTSRETVSLFTSCFFVDRNLSSVLWRSKVFLKFQ